MNIGQAGAMTPVYERATQTNTNVFQQGATAADFAAMMKKLAGPEMLWKEQPAGQTPECTAGDDTDARGVLASGYKLRR